MAFALLLSVAASPQNNGQQKPAGPRTGDPLRHWIEELDSDSFTARETATRKLIDTGLPPRTGLLLADARRYFPGDEELQSSDPFPLELLASHKLASERNG